MTRYAVEPRDRIFAKGYEFVSFTKTMGKNIGKKTSRNVSSKYSQKPIDHAKQSATDAIKTSKRAIQKTAEAKRDLIGNKIADKISRASKTSPKNNSETNEEEILRDKYVSPELRKNLLIMLRLKERN